MNEKRKKKCKFFFLYADDYNRVVLDPIEGEPDSDYINASYVDVSKTCIYKSIPDRTSLFLSVPFLSQGNSVINVRDVNDHFYKTFIRFLNESCTKFLARIVTIASSYIKKFKIKV